MLVILIFKHNQLSVTKLVEDNTCKVSFFNGFCIITSTVNDEVKGVGKSKIGLYYLQNELMEETLSELKRMLCVVKQTHQRKMVMNVLLNPCSITNIHQLGKAELWHYRLGHAPTHTLINSSASQRMTRKKVECVLCVQWPNLQNSLIT